MDRESLELLLRQGMSLAEIGRRLGRHPTTVAYWLKQHGLTPVYRERHAAKGGIDQSTLAALVAGGLTIRAIAHELGFSHAAVRYWLAKYRLATAGMERRKAGAAAREAGKAIAKLECRTHGVTDFWIEGRGVYRCLRCRGERVSRRRRKIKQMLIEEAGGRCSVCGYNRYPGALGFHHLDPATKSFGIAQNHTTMSLARLREEARKCVLLCANCHSEVEAGLVSVVA